MHPLFSDAPVTPPSQLLPAQPVGSGLAAALSRSGQPLQLHSASFGSIPLASMMQMAGQNAGGTGSNVTSSTPSLAWNPDNPVGTDALGGGTANQGGVLSNLWASLQANPPPGVPTQGMPGVSPMAMGANPAAMAGVPPGS